MNELVRYEKKIYQDIPLLRPGVDYMLTGKYTYDEDQYLTAANSEYIQKLLNAGRLYAELRTNWYNDELTSSLMDCNSLIFHVMKPMACKIIKWIPEEYKCTIEMFNSVMGYIATQYLNSTDDYFTYMGIDSIGRIACGSDKAVDVKFHKFCLTPVPKNTKIFEDHFKTMKYSKSEMELENKLEKMNHYRLLV